MPPIDRTRRYGQRILTPAEVRQGLLATKQSIEFFKRFYGWNDGKYDDAFEFTEAQIEENFPDRLPNDSAPRRPGKNAKEHHSSTIAYGVRLEIEASGIVRRPGLFDPSHFRGENRAPWVLPLSTRRDREANPAAAKRCNYDSIGQRFLIHVWAITRDELKITRGDGRAQCRTPGVRQAPADEDGPDTAEDSLDFNAPSDSSIPSDNELSFGERMRSKNVSRNGVYAQKDLKALWLMICRVILVVEGVSVKHRGVSFSEAFCDSTAPGAVSDDTLSQSNHDQPSSGACYDGTNLSLARFHNVLQKKDDERVWVFAPDEAPKELWELQDRSNSEATIRWAWNTSKRIKSKCLLVFLSRDSDTVMLLPPKNREYFEGMKQEALIPCSDLNRDGASKDQPTDVPPLNTPSPSDQEMSDANEGTVSSDHLRNKFCDHERS